MLHLSVSSLFKGNIMVFLSCPEERQDMQNSTKALLVSISLFLNSYLCLLYIFLECLLYHSNKCVNPFTSCKI